jgi:tRNA(Ile)-lysidine synthetase-like protein
VARIAPGAGYVRPRDPARAAFDADQLPASLVVRGRAVGDRLVVCGGGVRRLKSLFIDAKVPRWERARTPIIEASGRILWVAGLRCADAAPVGPATRRVLELTLGPPRDSAVAPARGSPVESAC